MRRFITLVITALLLAVLVSAMMAARTSTSQGQFFREYVGEHGR